jgi:hypothetical protein
MARVYMHDCADIDRLTCGSGSGLCCGCATNAGVCAHDCCFCPVCCVFAHGDPDCGCADAEKSGYDSGFDLSYVATTCET